VVVVDHALLQRNLVKRALFATCLLNFHSRVDASCIHGRLAELVFGPDFKLFQVTLVRIRSAALHDAAAVVEVMICLL
jgi:hypothetical protein